MHGHLNVKSIVECVLRFQGFVPMSSVVVDVPLDG